MKAIAVAAGDRVLPPHGFRREGLRWSAAAGDGIEWIVEVEKEKHTHSKDEIGFTVAWGVGVAGFDDLYDEKSSKHPWEAAVNGRVTDLADRRGGWWIVTTSGTSLFGLRRRPTDEQMAEDIAGRLDRDLLPFLAPLRTRAAVADLIRRRGEYLTARKIWPWTEARQLDHVAALQILDGDADGALATLRTARERAEARGNAAQVEHTVSTLEKKARGAGR